MNKALSIRELWRGKDLYRMLMNAECANCALKGLVLDVGSSANLASYHRFFKKDADVKIVSLDISAAYGEARHSVIDLERDALPYADASADVVLAFNIFEHVYNHAFLASELKRVLKPEGRLMGAVPFLVGYHPDPRDYWRYTSEALENILRAAGFKDVEIKVLGRGPFSAAYAQVEFMLPRALKTVKLPVVLALDDFILRLKPKLDRRKFALGLFFTAAK